MRTRMSAVLVLLMAAAAAWGQDDERVLLRYQWSEGEQIVWNVTTESTGMVLTRDLTRDLVEERATPIWSRVLVPLTLAVEEVDEDGSGKVVYELRDLSTVNPRLHASTGRIHQGMEDRLGSHDADGLSALKAAQMEALIDRIADRVAAKPVTVERARCLQDD